MTEVSGALEPSVRAHGEVVLLVEDEALLLDLSKRMMERLGYDELVDNLRALRPGLRCLFMSGHTANVIAHHGVLEEGVASLEKPFSVQGLIAVGEVLAKGR
jgi:FixJ family two-component response regulator